MAHKSMPYVLPVITFIILSVLLIFARPTITGLFIAQPNPAFDIEIKITAEEILPENAVMSIYLLNKGDQTTLELEKSSIKEFVDKYNVSLKYETGKNSQLDYEGDGYVGNVKVDIAETDLKGIESGEYNVKIEISYKGDIISSSEQKISI